LGASPAARWHLSTLEPARIVLEQRAQERAAISLLIGLWCRDSVRGRLSGIGDMLSGRDMALGRSNSAPHGLGDTAKNAFKVAKLFVYQLWLYARRVFLRSPQTFPEYAQ
ncbi:MAG: hypothetical protein ABI852_06290, partial [Gemmatimonadaceae bacterium]